MNFLKDNFIIHTILFFGMLLLAGYYPPLLIGWLILAAVVATTETIKDARHKKACEIQRLEFKKSHLQSLESELAHLISNGYKSDPDFHLERLHSINDEIVRLKIEIKQMT